MKTITQKNPTTILWIQNPQRHIANQAKPKVAQQLENSRGIATERWALIADLRAKGEERPAGAGGVEKCSMRPINF